jgi:hypothetical protein
MRIIPIARAAALPASACGEDSGEDSGEVPRLNPRS